MTESLEAFHAKFRVADLTLARSAHWTWSLRPIQTTVGAGILSLNRFCTSFADLTPGEAADLAVIVRVIEERLKAAFASEKFNYIMLMMVDLHLHFHVIPRYGSATACAGLTWQDKAWPMPPALNDYAERDTPEVLGAIRDALRG